MSTTTAVSSVEVPPGESLSALVDWVKAGAPVDQEKYRPSYPGDPDPDATKGVVSFTSPSGKMACDTEGGLVFCDVRLLDPPPRPVVGQGNWESGWIDYRSTTASIGSLAGGIRVGWGLGPVLPYGSRVDFGDYSCRLEADGLTCVDPAVNTGVRISDGGIVPFGCLHRLSGSDPASSSKGVEFGC
ncbi:hypothetical protein ACFXHA_40485 [Nocardia sp. NPDC059240]|uniref:hypothetical protein n=1 Tax=Nocardia sp. NPDC059240 TaxID=3346786 RepID=UPI00368C1B26